ncbi:hypothetical protein BCR36DRAFT_585718 [Piromyces finnis]|uniref:alpha-galactosidase n=1 Tax=Piromyces finnis TaxID=1754191 RepID=A0A1Y1V2X9_9FUNG|nr:hypothetical protein BCR36DRAFT_585718 [Piromyces finnis]|eukprot:ORX45406.1 hypothetical protein BCR36DRAFT_585718 [Piromyces finnis]
MKLLLPVIMLTSIVLTNNVEARWTPRVGLTWNYVLGNDVDVSIEKADVVDMDINKSVQKIESLHNAGKKVICYFSGGTIEDFRDDFDQFMKVPGLVKNTFEDWPEERWLDYRVSGVKPLIQARMKRAASKNCDGVEVDNLDGYQMDEVQAWKNPLTKNDAIKYAKWLATTAHSLGLSIGLKNTLGIIEDVGDYFDFAINEECVKYNECYRYKNFINKGKPVFGVTYNGVSKYRDALCKNLNGLGMSMIVKEKHKLVQEGIIFNGKTYCGSSFDDGFPTSRKVTTTKKTTTTAKKTTTTKKTTTKKTTTKKVTTTRKTTTTKRTTTTKKRTTTTNKKIATTKKGVTVVKTVIKIVTKKN